ncbi:MAG: alpha/beta hydrolase family protein [Ketobacteraceae bacterium]|nr:alpha/beta hydrolase family protein [Ketobacteraceae bacterium]
MGIASNVSRVANKTYSHTRRIMPDQPWWDNLETSFHKFPDDFELNFGTQLLVDGTVAADVALRTAAASLVSCLALPLSANPVQLLQDFKDSEIYRSKADSHDPEAFFVRPVKGAVEVKSRPGGFFDFRPTHGTCELLYFDSPFVPVNPSLRGRYRKNRNNMRAVAQYWRHNNGPRPTICVIHGFMADPYWLNRMFLALPWFYDQGYDILLYTLPHHGARKGTLAPFSGHGYFAGGISNINETVAHSVYDFRIFMDYLESQGVEKIGVTGISLGGYTSALLAAVEERLYFSIPNVPVVSLFDLMLQWFPASAVLKAGLRLSNLSIRDARHMLAVHCPLTYQPLIPNERLMIIGGAGDRLAPPKHSRLLWDHWDRCRIHWFPGNHVIHFDRGKYLREVALFLKQIRFNLK